MTGRARRAEQHGGIRPASVPTYRLLEFVLDPCLGAKDPVVLDESSVAVLQAYFKMYLFNLVGESSRYCPTRVRFLANGDYRERHPNPI